MTDDLEKNLSDALRSADRAPALGFESRLLARAHARVKTRQRRRVILVGANLALAAAAAVVLAHGALVPHRVESTPLPAGENLAAVAPAAAATADDTAVITDLLEWSDTRRALAVHANWHDAEAPLAAYAVLLSTR